MTLDDFTRYVAVVIAILGAFVVSPQGAALFSGRMWAPIRKARMRLSKWLPFLRRPPLGLSGTLAARSSTVSMSARGRSRPPWPEQPTVNALAVAVQGWLARVDADLDDLWTAVEIETSRAKSDVNDVRLTLRTAQDDLEGRIHETERQAAELDSRAIPVLGLGAVMGTLSGELASLPLWIYLPILAAAVSFSADATFRAWRLRRGGSAPG
jgi:hypothetical protein